MSGLPPYHYVSYIWHLWKTLWLTWRSRRAAQRRLGPGLRPRLPIHQPQPASPGIPPAPTPPEHLPSLRTPSPARPLAPTHPARQPAQQAAELPPRPPGASAPAPAPASRPAGAEEGGGPRGAEPRRPVLGGAVRRGGEGDEEAGAGPQGACELSCEWCLCPFLLTPVFCLYLLHVILEVLGC